MAFNRLAKTAFAAAALAGASTLSFSGAQAQSFTPYGTAIGHFSPAQLAASKHAAAFLDQHFDMKGAKDSATVRAIVQAGTALGYSHQALMLRVKYSKLAQQVKSRLSELPAERQIYAVRELLKIASNEPYEIRTDQRLSDPAVKSFFSKLAAETAAFDAEFTAQTPANPLMERPHIIFPPKNPGPKMEHIPDRKTEASGLNAMAYMPSAQAGSPYAGQFPGIFDNDAQSTFKLLGERIAQSVGGPRGAELQGMVNTSLLITYCAARKYGGRIPADAAQRDPDVRTVLYTTGLVAMALRDNPYYTQAKHAVHQAKGTGDFDAQIDSIIEAGARAGTPGRAYPRSTLPCPIR